MWKLVVFTVLFVGCQSAPQFPQGGAPGGAPGGYAPQYQQQPQQFAPQQQFAGGQPQYAAQEPQPQYGAQPQPQYGAQPQQRKQPSNIIPVNVYNGFGKDGSLNFAFQTLDGQQRAESLGSDGSVKGSYSYLGADGKQVEIKYVADKNGFHASGPTIPKPSPAFALASAQAAQRHGGDDGAAAGGAPQHFGGGGQFGGGSQFGGGGHFGGGDGGYGFGGPAFAGSQGAPAIGGGQSYQGFQGGQSSFPGQQQYAPFQG